jgi:hypothetical protein
MMIHQVINAYRSAGGGGTDPNFANVVLLMGFEGANNSTSFVDESPVARTMTAAGNAKITTSQFKFGSSCATYDGSGDYISTPNSADFAFANNPFTVEGFFRFQTKTDSQMMIGYVNDNGSAPGTAWLFAIISGQLLFRIYTPDAIAVMNCQIPWAPTIGASAPWYHLAFDRDATGRGRIYRDGAMVTSLLMDHTVQTTAGHLVLGSIGFGDPFPTFDFNGQMDEVRITKGVARYGSDDGFTVPAAAYPRS